MSGAPKAETDRTPKIGPAAARRMAAAAVSVLEVVAPLIVIRFLSLEGILYTFAVPPKNALEIAERLKTEALKHHQVGQA
jgi:hypothetical protein